MFRNHITKNELVVALLLPVRDTVANQREVVDEKIFSWWNQIKPIPEMMESRRKFCVYVGQDDDGRIHSPEEVGELETEALLKVIERLLVHIEKTVKHSSVEYKERFRKIMSSLPKNFWKTGTLSKEDLKLIQKVEGIK